MSNHSIYTKNNEVMISGQSFTSGESNNKITTTSFVSGAINDLSSNITTRINDLSSNITTRINDLSSNITTRLNSGLNASKVRIESGNSRTDTLLIPFTDGFLGNGTLYAQNQSLTYDCNTHTLNVTNLFSSGKLGFFGHELATKLQVTAPEAITATASVSAPTKQEFDKVVNDLTNLRNTLNNLVSALNGYGLV